MHSSQSLRSRFALLIALLVAGLSWLFGSLISQDASRRMAEEVGRDLTEVSHLMVDRLDRDMHSRAGMLAVLGRLRALTAPQDLEEIGALLNRLQDKFPSFAWIGFTDPHGRVLASSDGILQGVSIAQRPVYLQGREGLFVGDVHEAVLLAGLLPNPSGEAMKFVDISLPVHAKDGSLVGVLASHLSWAWAEEVRQAILEPIQQRRNVEFFVIGQDRTVLLGDKRMLGQRLDLAALDGLGKGQSRWSLERWPDGGHYLTGLSLSHGYQDYPGLGWTVIARQPVDEAYAPAHEMQRSILLWGSALAALFALLGWLLADYVTRPLRQIAKAADRLSAGVITEIPDIRSTREISRLSQSIRHLVDSLSHQQAALGKMENLAHHDPLTGLPNRAALEKFLASAAQHCPAQNNHLALLYLDLDGFKPVNDRFGHAAGDQLLQEVAARLRGCLRDGDLVARLGGDEFVMVLRVPGAEALPQARLVAQRVLNVLSAPLPLGKHQVGVSCSIGGAIWPQDHRAIEQALELADKALYRAKHAGKNCAEFHVPPSQEANASAPPAAPHGTQIAPS